MKKNFKIFAKIGLIALLLFAFCGCSNTNSADGISSDLISSDLISSDLISSDAQSVSSNPLVSSSDKSSDNIPTSQSNSAAVSFAASSSQQLSSTPVSTPVQTSSALPASSAPVSSSSNSSDGASSAGTIRISSNVTRPVIDKSADLATVKSTWNQYISKVYNLEFYPYGIGNETDDFPNIAEFIQNDDGRFGLLFSGWRNSYDSDSYTNDKLNVVLDTFYYICGDQAVATATWKLLDEYFINGTADTDNFGFTMVNTTDLGAVVQMNNVQVEIEETDVLVIWLN